MLLQHDSSSLGVQHSDFARNENPVAGRLPPYATGVLRTTTSENVESLQSESSRNRDRDIGVDAEQGDERVAVRANGQESEAEGRPGARVAPWERAVSDCTGTEESYIKGNHYDDVERYDHLTTSWHRALDITERGERLRPSSTLVVVSCTAFFFFFFPMLTTQPSKSNACSTAQV